MPTANDIFTPIDELRITEPSYFTMHSAITSDAAATSFSQKTPVMALDEGSRRVYGTGPEYQLISEDPNHGFGYTCRLMGSCVTEYAKTKKAAKHRAARAMLHEIVKKDRYDDFGIPGQSQEEAHRAVDALVIGDVRGEASGDDPSSPGCQNENYSGKLLQLCQRKKFDIPKYDTREEGPPNDRTFITTCKVVGQEVKGVAKTKRSSKNIASKEMLAILEKGLADMNEEPDLDRGLIQCLLKITFSKPGEQQLRTPYVFPGSHSTEEGAKQQAARGAVLFLSL
ncbi:hypothetical protein GCK32_010442 [Trichostrongylus colubriformis]|uniref:DRBM domain-containing protein n=1 Tax=Trichostrongylus colubriformis TaxID=6319 RepID=A0AAN8IJF9_TRICO